MARPTAPGPQIGGNESFVQIEMEENKASSHLLHSLCLHSITAPLSLCLSASLFICSLHLFDKVCLSLSHPPSLSCTFEFLYLSHPPSLCLAAVFYCPIMLSCLFISFFLSHAHLVALPVHQNRFISPLSLPQFYSFSQALQSRSVPT